MTLVTFKNDVFPYCKGDTVDLDKDELKRVDKLVDDRNIEGAYSASGSAAGKPPTKKELLESALDEGLDLGEISDKNTVAEITEAIQTARQD